MERYKDDSAYSLVSRGRIAYFALSGSAQSDKSTGVALKQGTRLFRIDLTNPEVS